MMSVLFKRVLIATITAHVSFVILLFGWQWLTTRAPPIKKKDIVTFVDLSGGGGPPPSTIPVASIQPPAAIPELPKPATVPEPKPKKPKIEKSTNLVHRKDVASKPKTPAISAAQIKELLTKGISFKEGVKTPKTGAAGYGFGTGGGGGGGGADSPVAWYYALVRQIMYDAWEQPGGLSAEAGWTAEVTIRVERDGTVSDWKMTRPSGNSMMDDSVKKAVESVKQIRPLPSQFVGNYQDIVVLFELTKDVI